MQKPTMRWVSLSTREVKFADIALVEGTLNLSQNTPPSKLQTKILSINAIRCRCENEAKYVSSVINQKRFFIGADT